VVSDPLELGGFDEGTKFSDMDVAYMLRFRTFTPETVLRHRQYGKFTVVSGNRIGQSDKMRNSKYIARVGNGQKLLLTPRPHQVRVPSGDGSK
jgi:hypothetical protein